HLSNKEERKAQKLLSRSFHYLSHLWGDAIEQECVQASRTVARSSTRNSDFENNESIPSKIKKELRPYVISDKHPMKSKLDAIFLKKRATVDEKTFKACGFRIISKRPRSLVYVAKHKSLPGYLVKAYMDTELKEKYHKPSWKWLVRRCQG